MNNLFCRLPAVESWGPTGYPWEATVGPWKGVLPLLLEVSGPGVYQRTKEGWEGNNVLIFQIYVILVNHAIENWKLPTYLKSWILLIYGQEMLTLILKWEVSGLFVLTGYDQVVLKLKKKFMQWCSWFLTSTTESVQRKRRSSIWMLPTSELWWTFPDHTFIESMI